MSPKFNSFYMTVAAEAAKLSHAVKLKVGAVIVRDRNILAYGYNGTPAGMDNVCEEKIYCDEIPPDSDGRIYYDQEREDWYVFVTKPEVLHAEENAILKIAQSSDSTNGATIYCTHEPCIRCSRMIFSSGIKSVFYSEKYRTNEGSEFLKRQGIEVTHYEP